MHRYEGLIPITIGFVGHREVNNNTSIKPLIKKFLEETLNRYEHTPIIVMSALAQGVDQIAVQVALNLKVKEAYKDRIRIVCPLPMTAEQYVAPWSEHDKGAFFELYNNEHVDPFSFPMSENQKCQCEQERNIQFAMVGSYISRYSHLLVAGWDGDVRDTSEQAVGTSFIIRDRLTDIEFSDALQKTRTGVIHEDVLLPPKLGFINDLEGPIVHLYCQRDEKEELSQGWRWLNSKKISNDRKKYYQDLIKIPYSNDNTFYEGLNKDVCEILTTFEAYNVKALKLEPKKGALQSDAAQKQYSWAYGHITYDEIDNDYIEKNQKELEFPDSDLNEDERKSLIRLKHSYIVADVLASGYRDDSYKWAKRILIVALGSLAIFITNDRLPDAPLWLPLLYAWFLLTTLYVAHLARKNRTHIEHLEYRFLSEAIRIQLAWKIAGLHSSVFWYIPKRYYVSRNWMQWALRGLSIFPPSDVDKALSPKRSRYVLGAWVKDQLNYYKKNKIENTEIDKNLDILAKGLKPRVRKAKLLSNIGIYSGLFLSVIVSLSSTVEWINKEVGGMPQEWISNYIDFSNSALVLSMMILLLVTGFSIRNIVKGLSWEDELVLYNNIAQFMEAIDARFERLLNDKEHSREEKESIGLNFLELGHELMIEKAQWVELNRRNQVHRKDFEGYKE